MGLSERNEEIYKRGYDERPDAYRTSYDPESARADVDADVDFGSKDWNASQVPDRIGFFGHAAAFFGRHRKAVIFGSVGVALIGAALFAFFLRFLLFSEDRVTVELSGPTDVASVERVSFEIRWKNDNRIGAGNLELSVVFPEEFHPDSREGMSLSGNEAVVAIGDVKGRTEGVETVSGRFYGPRGSTAVLRATVRFSSFGFSNRHEAESSLPIIMVTSPLSFEFVTPRRVVSGSEEEYVISYRNDGDSDIRNLEIRLSYPDSFHPGSIDPSPVGDGKTWNIGALAPGGGGEIRMRGTLVGGNERSASLVAEIGFPREDGSLLPYERKERLTTITVPPLSIVQTVNGKTSLVATPGDRLDYLFDYSNAGDIGLRDVVVTAEIDPGLLDMANLVFGGYGGSYDAERRIVTWRASDVPGLANLGPGEKGTVGFTVSVRDDIGSGNGLVIRTVARIDSPDIPFLAEKDKVVSSDMLEVRVGADASLVPSVSYDDPAFPGYGPMPSEVGKETGYALRFRVTNPFGDLVGAKMTATIPTDIRYSGKRWPDSESLEYNERTGRLVWNIGTIVGGGTVRELAIPVSVTPGPNLVGKGAELLQGAVLEGVDAFTEKEVRVESGALIVDVFSPTE